MRFCVEASTARDSKYNQQWTTKQSMIKADKPSVQSFVGNRSEHNYNSYKRQRNGPKVDETQLTEILEMISTNRQGQAHRNTARR